MGIFRYLGISIVMKNILFVTGTRADFGKLEPLAKAAIAEGYHVGFFVTGMHMLKKYGSTNMEVRNVHGAEIFEYVNQKEGDELDSILAKTVVGFSDFVHENRPDLVVVHGDRIESTAVSIVCAMNYIYSAHIEGGEVSGTIDESLRHCNSKLCSTHFVSSKDAADRVIRLGEEKERVYVIGSPELDSHFNVSGVDIAEVKCRYEIPFEQYGVVVFHPVTSERESMACQAQSLYAALVKSGKNFVVIAPNNDPGSKHIFEIINTLPTERFRVIPSMRFQYFSQLLKSAAVVVGNSSVGVREAPFIGVSSIDVGSRQKNRAVGNSIINCSAYDEDRIITLLSSDFWAKRYDSAKNFGCGDSCSKFVEVLSSEKFWSHSKQKIFSND